MGFSETLGGKTNVKKTPAFGSQTRNKLTTGQNLPNLASIGSVGTNTSMRQYGPSVLGLGTKPVYVGGPGEPPAGFVGGTTSATEWYFYWACEKILGPEGIRWDFQSSQMGGRHQAGGAVVDFVIMQNRGLRVGVRIQTYRFHQNVDSFKQAYDIAQFRALYGPDFIIIDVFEDQYINDQTGQAAIVAVLEVINNKQRPNPLANGWVVGTG